MTQTVIQIPLGGLLIAVIAVVCVIVYLVARLAGTQNPAEEESRKKVTGPVPFSEPRPFPEPVPPNLLPAQPVVPPANPLIRPTRYAYDQRYFERFYAPMEGRVEEICVQVNDAVKKGDILMHIKYGDTQSDLRASASGKIREINCRAGAAFRKDDLLYVIQ